MRVRRGMLWGVMWILVTPCLAQIRGEVQPATSVSLTGGTLTIDVNVDLRGVDKSLGSYGARLLWDPAALQYVSDAGGVQPFNSAVVNRTNVGNGLLRFSDASPTGARGLVNILKVTFKVVAKPCLTSTLSLGFTSLSAAETFENLLPLLQVQDATTNITDYLFNLRVFGQPDTFLQWDPVLGAVTYDVIRGTLDMVSGTATLVHLGAVSCLENNSRDTTTAAGTEAPNPDTATPPVHNAFFYLVRFHDGVQNSTYGFTMQCARERFVDAGDCP